MESSLVPAVNELLASLVAGLQALVQLGSSKKLCLIDLSNVQLLFVNATGSPL